MRPVLCATRVPAGTPVGIPSRGSARSSSSTISSAPATPPSPMARNSVSRPRAVVVLSNPLACAAASSTPRKTCTSAPRSRHMDVTLSGVTRRSTRFVARLPDGTIIRSSNALSGTERPSCACVQWSRSSSATANSPATSDAKRFSTTIRSSNRSSPAAASWWAAIRTATLNVLAACTRSSARANASAPVSRSTTATLTRAGAYDAAALARASVRRSSSGLLLPHLEEVLPGIHAGVVPVAPVDAHGVAADGLQVVRPHVGADLRLTDGTLAAPLVHAPRAGAARAQPLRREPALGPIVPAHHHPALRRDGDVARPHRRHVWLDLVEKSHASLYVTCTTPAFAPQAATHL